MTEIWKTVAGYGGRYSVSSEGRVYSSHNKGSYLKDVISVDGYARVSLSENNKRTLTSTHRLVAFAFIPNPEDKPTVNHKDGCKLNNCVGNLEWATNSEQIRHAIDTGLMTRPHGKEAKAYRGPIDVYNLEDKYLYSLHGNTELRAAGFNPSLVCLVIQGQRRQHKQHIFKRNS